MAEVKKSQLTFKELGNFPATNSTDIYLSAGYEGKDFKGYYLSKKFSIKDSADPSKEVKVFAKGAYRIDTLEQLKNLRDLIDKAITSNEK